MFVPDFTTTPANAAEFDVVDTGWYQDSVYGKFTGTFEAGKEYIYEIVLKAKDGYRFPVSGGAYQGTALLNGEEPYYADADTLGSYAYIGVKFTLTAPDAPNVKITTSAGHPKLTWDAVDGAAKYWIYRSTDGVNFKYYDSTTKTTYTNSSVTEGTTYTFTMPAYAVAVLAEFEAAKPVIREERERAEHIVVLSGYDTERNETNPETGAPVEAASFVTLAAVIAAGACFACRKNKETK